MPQSLNFKSVVSANDAFSQFIDRHPEWVCNCELSATGRRENTVSVEVRAGNKRGTFIVEGRAPESQTETLLLDIEARLRAALDDGKLRADQWKVNAEYRDMTTFGSSEVERILVSKEYRMTIDYYRKSVESTEATGVTAVIEAFMEKHPDWKVSFFQQYNLTKVEVTVSIVNENGADLGRYCASGSFETPQALPLLLDQLEEVLKKEISRRLTGASPKLTPPLNPKVYGKADYATFTEFGTPATPPQSMLQPDVKSSLRDNAIDYVKGLLRGGGSGGGKTAEILDRAFEQTLPSVSRLAIAAFRKRHADWSLVLTETPEGMLASCRPQTNDFECRQRITMEQDMASMLQKIERAITIENGKRGYESVTITRAEFDALSLADRMKFATTGNKIVDNLPESEIRINSRAATLKKGVLDDLIVKASKATFDKMARDIERQILAPPTPQESNIEQLARLRAEFIELSRGAALGSMSSENFARAAKVQLEIARLDALVSAARLDSPPQTSSTPITPAPDDGPKKRRRIRLQRKEP
jgi:hypothetical protein